MRRAPVFTRLEIWLAEALWNANQSTEVSNIGTGEPRSFHPCVFKPPEQGLIRAVVVAFAHDAIELWPLKVRRGKFEHAYYPVAAISADSAPEFVALSVFAMLG